MLHQVFVYLAQRRYVGDLTCTQKRVIRKKSSKFILYGTPPGIPGLVQTNITNSAKEKWALLDKDIKMEDSETENETQNLKLYSSTCAIYKTYYKY